MKNLFLIIGSARTGSQLLRTLLNSHEKIYVFEELFNENNVKEITKDYIGHLNKTLNTSSNNYVGFKIFYYHAYQNKIFWKYLQNNFSVIHLVRRNILKNKVSLTLAELTNQWGEINYSKDINLKLSRYPKDINLELSYKECFDYFCEYEYLFKKFDKFFKNNKMIKIYYEDLLKEDTHKKVQEFLGVDVKKLYSPSIKQRTRKISTIVTNYQKLKEKFKGTKWECFFE